MQYAFQLNKPHKKKKPGKQKTVGQKVDLLFFYPTKEYLLFLYITVIEVLFLIGYCSRRKFKKVWMPPPSCFTCPGLTPSKSETS